MGGTIFTAPGPNGEPALPCPRMSPLVYTSLRDKYTDILKIYYSHVTCPPEAPEKRDHGDVDFLVCGSHKPEHQPLTETLSSALSATRTRQPAENTISFAVPISLPLDELRPSASTQTETTFPRHVQIDLTILPSLESLAYTTLTHSYGDLTQILGLSLRPLGLTFRPQGFTLRITIIEDASTANPAVFSREATLLQLSLDTAEILRFLGLNMGVYRTGFGTLDDLFRWVTRGRLFDREYFSRRTREDGEDEEVAEDASVKGWNAQARARDRMRMRKRGQYRAFVEDWLPGHPDAGARAGSEPLRREVVMEEALEAFGKREEFEGRMRWFLEERREVTFWESVKRVLPLEDGKKSNLVLRGLRRWVGFVEDEGEEVVGDDVLSPRADVDSLPNGTTDISAADTGKRLVPRIARTPQLDPLQYPKWTATLPPIPSIPTFQYNPTHSCLSATPCEKEVFAPLLAFATANWERVLSLEKARMKADADTRKHLRNAYDAMEHHCDSVEDC